MKNNRILKIKRRVRSNLIGTKSRPRMSVHRTGKHIYAQLINDENATTLESFSSSKLDKIETKGKTKVNELSKVTFHPHFDMLPGHEGTRHRAFRRDPGEVVAPGRGHSWSLARPEDSGVDFVDGWLPSDLSDPALWFKPYDVDALGAPAEPGRDPRGPGETAIGAADRPDRPLAATVGPTLGTAPRAAWAAARRLGWPHFGRASTTAFRPGVDGPPSAEMAASLGLSFEAGELCVPAGASPGCGAVPPALKKNFAS